MQRKKEISEISLISSLLYLIGLETLILSWNLHKPPSHSQHLSKKKTENQGG
jgi:hypothetical protein